MYDEEELVRCGECNTCIHRESALYIRATGQFACSVKHAEKLAEQPLTLKTGFPSIVPLGERKDDQ